MTAKKRGGYEQASCVCAGCQGDARCVGLRERWVDSLLGQLKVRRHYYHCPKCRHGVFPRDQKLGLGRRTLSPAAAQVVSIVGVQTSFAQASEVTLAKLCGLKLSESTVERVTEDAGARLQELLAQGKTFVAPTPLEWQVDARGKTCAYVSLDATGVRQQGAKGAAAEGRMAYVGMIYNAASDHDARPLEPHSVRYLAGFYNLFELGQQLRRQAAKAGWDDAEQQLALSDGGNGLEEFFRVNFPRAERILDFWHASDHRTQLGLALYPHAEEERSARVETWCHQLKHEGGLRMVWRLAALDLSACSPAQRTAHGECLGYFQNHQHKMAYPRYLANGWQIGSGPVESACKLVVGSRLKQSGMRWGPTGSNAVCHLRALYLSQPGGWDAYWKTSPN